MKDLKEMSLKELLENLLISDNIYQGTKDIIRASLAEILEEERIRQKPTDLALTEDEADQVEDWATVQLSGYWYMVEDIEAITWVGADGETYEAELFSQSQDDMGWLEADQLCVILSDGTELEVEVYSPDTDTELIYQIIQPL